MPVQETTEVAKAVTFNWPQVTAVLGGISMFLTFIGSVVWKYIDSKDKSTKKEDTDDKGKKQEELRALYEVLRCQSSHLQAEVSRIDSATAKEIEKLEAKIDKLIDMMIKGGYFDNGLVSEED